ncbi:hypothetical protein OF83DRAFT_567460 [Amylostereum chailletii]|nr:hypothetical protein OF83DRAFT_567460 [Amylostereum chailletii]
MSPPFPALRLTDAFTTSNAVHTETHNIDLVPLTDVALGVHKISNPSVLTHNIVTAPTHRDGTQAWEAKYPSGSINPSGRIKGGFGFYLAGAEGFKHALQRTGTREVFMGYEVLFEPGFQWVKGGKLPGIFGGTGDLAYRCTGGRQDERCKCFNLRLMWRANGLGELYAYIPLTDTNAARLLAVPNSHQNSDYGISVGRGAWKFEAGKWVAVGMRVKLNAIGVEDGEVEVYVDGKSVIHATGLSLRDDPTSHVKGMHFQTFFGGHTPDWASPCDQRAWFASVTGGIVSAPSRGRDEL